MRMEIRRSFESQFQKMEQIESAIRRVLQDHQKISSSIRSEEAKIDGLNREIKLSEDRIRVSEERELERQRMQNLLNYQSTLIARASSRTDVIRALHEDLLILFIRRKELRESDGAGGPGVDMVPNVSLSSGLSSGDDDNQGFPNDCSIPASIDIMRINDVHENLEEVTTADQDQLPLGLKLLQTDMDENACLTPEDGNDYGSLHDKNNILENIAMSIVDPNADVENIFKEAMENSDFPCEETQGSKIMPKRAGRVTYRNVSRRLTVDFDETGNPTGPNAGAFKRSINSYVCHFLPIRFKQIGDVSVEDYKSVLHMLTDKYNFDINRSYTRKKISSCYRQHKYKLLIQVKKDLESGIEPQQPSYVKKEDWDAFVAKTKDEEFDKISKKNKASRSQQSSGNRKGLSCTPVHKRKLKESEQESVDACMWPKMHKHRRGRPRKLLTVVEDNHNVVDTVGESGDFNVDQEDVHQQGFELERPLKDYQQLGTPNQYEYWNTT